MSLSDLVTQPIDQQAFRDNPEEYKYQSLKDELRAVNQRGDRQETMGWIKALKNDPALEGMSEKDVGRMIQRTLGGQEKAGFDRFSSASRWLDAAGYTIMEGGKHVAGEYTGAAMKGLAGMFTDDKDKLEYWRQAGEYIPGGLGMLATAFIPGVGLPAMLSLTYGAGSEGARARGVGGWAAPAAGAIDAATSALFVKVGPGIGNRIADGITKKMGTSKAIMDLAKETSEGLFQQASKEGLLTGAQKVGVEVASHTVAELGMGAAGTVAAAGKELLLYANEPGRERWLQEWWDEIGANPDFWATSMATESGFALVGHVIGRGVNSRLARERGTLAEQAPGSDDAQLGAMELDPGVAALQAQRAAEAKVETESFVETIDPVSGDSIDTTPSPNAVGSFKTSRGSVYSVFDNGTTQRKQVAVPEEGVTPGTKNISGATVFMTPDVAMQVKGLDLNANNARFVTNEDGTLRINKVENGQVVGTWMDSVPVTTQPELGMHPVEFRNVETREGNAQGFKQRYIGTPITEIRSLKTEVDPNIPMEPSTPFTGDQPKAPEMQQLEHIRNEATLTAEVEVNKTIHAASAITDAAGTVISEPIAPRVLNIDQVVLLAGNSHDANTGSLSNSSPVQDGLNGVQSAKTAAEAEDALRKTVVDAVKVYDNLPVQPNEAKVIAATANRLVVQRDGGAEIKLDADFLNAPFDPVRFTNQGLKADAIELLNSIDQGGAAPAFISKRLEQVANNNGVMVTGAMTPVDVITALRNQGTKAGTLSEDGVIAQRFHEDYQRTINNYRQTGQRMVFDDEFVTPQQQQSWIKFAQDSGIHDALRSVNGTVVFVDNKNSQSWINTMMTDNYANSRLVPDVNGPMFFINADVTRNGYLHEFGHVVDHLIRIDGFGPETRLEWEGLIDRVYNDPNLQEQLGVTKMAQAVQSEAGEAVTPTASMDSYYRTRAELAANGFQSYMLDKPTKFREFIKTNFKFLDALIVKFTDSFRKLQGFIKRDDLTIRQQYLFDNFSPGAGEFNKFFHQLFKSTDYKPVEYHQEFNALIKDKLSPVVYEKSLEAFHSMGEAQQQTFVAGLKTMLNMADPNKAVSMIVEPYLRQVNRVNRMVGPEALEGLYMRLMEKGDGTKSGMYPEDSWADFPNARKLFGMMARNNRPMLAVQEAVSYHIRKQELPAYDDFGDMGMAAKAMLDQMGLTNTLVEVDAVVGKWLLGELDGQDGVPMYDTGKLDLANADDSEVTFKRNLDGGKDTYQSEVDRAMAETKRHYPILWGALSKIKSGKAVPEHGYFYAKADGTNEFVMSGDRKDRKNKRTTFDSKDEADAYRDIMQESAEMTDVLFEVVPVKLKSKADQGKTVWQIKGTKDKMGAVTRDWQSTLEKQSYTDYIGKAFPGDPKSAKYIKGLTDIIRKTDLGERDLGQVFGKVVRRSLQDYEQGLFKPVDSSEFHRIANAIKSFDEEVKSDPAMARWKNALVNEDLDIPQGVDKGTLNTTDLMLYAIEKGYKDPGFLQELQQYAPKAWTDMAESFGNFAYGLFKHELQIDLRDRMNGGHGKFGKDAYKLVSSVSHGMAPAELPSTMVGVTVAQLADPQTYNAWLRSGATMGNPKGNLFQRIITKAERGFHLTYGNQIQIGESHTLGKVFAEATVNEQGRVNYSGTDSVENFTHSGKFVDTPQGKRFIKDQQGKIDDEDYLAVHADKNLQHVADEIRRTSQEVKMTFEEMMNYDGADPDVKAVIDELKNDIMAYQKKAGGKFEKNMEHLNNFIIKSYAAKQTLDRHVIKNEREHHMVTTAHSLFKAAKDDAVRPEHAMEVSKALAKLLPTEPGIDPAKRTRVEILKNITGWDNQLAAKFDDAWLAGHNKISAMGAMREATPWYVTEKRHRRYLVPYVVKDDNGKGMSGMRDFDTPEEAAEFMKNAHKEGLIVTRKQPKDSWRLRDKSKPFNDTMQEAIEHVVNSQAEVMAIGLDSKVAKGAMTQAEADKIVNSIKNLKSNIEMELVAEGDSAMAHRFLKHGREHLDMTYQQMRGIWQDSIKSSRKITDAIYRLYSDDPVRQADKTMMARAEQARDQLRIADGELQQKASKTAFSLFMMLNPSTGIIEAAQFPLTLSHILVENGAGVMDAFRIPSMLAKQAGQASMNRIGGKDDSSVWSDPHHVKLIRMAERMGRMNVRNYMDINENVMQHRIQAYAALTDPGASKPVKSLAENVYKAGATFYGAFNRFNAELSLTSAFETLKRKQYGKKAKITDAQAEDLFRRAMDIADIANGAHGRAGRPIWFNNRSEGMRTVAQLGWSLQSYAQSYVSSWLRQITTSFAGEMKGKSKAEITQARKALAVSTTLQITGMGMMGIPLVGGIAKALQMAFGFNPEYEVKEWLDGKFDLSEADNLLLADSLLYGVQKLTGSPLDVRSRMTISGIGPLSEYEGFSVAGMGGPLVGMASSLIAGARNVRKGDDEASRWGVSMLPAGIQRAVRMTFFDDGKVFTKAGKYVMTPSTAETIGSFLGFSPTKYIDHVRATSMQRHAAELDSVERSRAANDLMKAMSDGRDQEAAALLEPTAQRLAMEPRDLANRIADKTIERMYGPQVREGKGPNAQLAARLYQSPLDKVPAYTRETTKLNTLAKLNHLPLDWSKRLERASEIDNLVSQTGMSESQARSVLKDQRGQTIPMGLPGLLYGSGLDEPLQ